MRLIEYFDRAYVVNLPERTDRRRQMRRELAAAQMPLASGKVELFPAVRPESAEGFESIGARGCFLSHLQILKTARDEGLGNVLIMEDDLALGDDFLSREQHIVAALREVDWDVVHFGYFCDELSQQSTTDAQALRPFDGTLIGTHFYAVNGPVFDRTVDFFEGLLSRPPGHPDGGPMHADGVYNFFKHKQPDLKRFVAVPSLGGQRSSRSDVTTKWFDRLPILSPLATAARGLVRR